MNELTVQQNIEHKIFTIRGVQVMIDRDLAELYGVEPKRLGEQVKRNIERFPDEFRFQLTEDEKNELVANCDRLQPLKHSSSLPYVFTEQGVSMLSAVLRSDTAIQTSINIINSFVTMRKYLLQNASLFQRVEKLELDQKQTNQKLESVLSAIESKSITPKQGVFFDGQIFDAYALMSEIVKKATQSLILIDNYIDESTLTHLSKADVKVKITILTKTITKQLELDIKKYNAQYGNVRAVEFASSHDRFLIIDAREIYHIGASLKDLGKKWFAFSLLEVESFGLMERVKKVVGDE